MSAVIDTLTFRTRDGAEIYLYDIGFVYVECLDQYVDDGSKWATVRQMPSGKWMVRIGVSTR